MDSTKPRAVTLKDVARVAGVHAATVSRALDPARQHLVNDETRERVRQAAADLGFQANAFARSLRKGSSGLVGVVVADVANPFLPPILRGIEQEVRSDGLLLLIAETHDDSATLGEILSHFASRRVDALILCAAHEGDREVVRTAAAAMPVVLAVRSVSGSGLPTVTHDDALGGRLAAEHLVELGHRSIAQLRGPQDVSSFAGRASGFAAVMARTEARDVSTDSFAVAPTTAEGFRLTTELLERKADQPTAIFAHNDLMAVGALDALKERGLRCPDDVSIVGYNDAPLTDHIKPSLTSVRLPGLKVGQLAAQMALALVKGETVPEEIDRLAPTLVRRESSGPANA